MASVAVPPAYRHRVDPTATAVGADLAEEAVLVCSSLWAARDNDAVRHHPELPDWLRRYERASRVSQLLDRQRSATGMPPLDADSTAADGGDGTKATVAMSESIATAAVRILSDSNEVRLRHVALDGAPTAAGGGIRADADSHHLNPLLSSDAQALASSPGLAPPQTPGDVVHDAALWWGFGQHASPERWIGHGRAWRGRPFDAPSRTVLLENAAGNACNDYDVVEPGFRRLRNATVLCLDHALVRRDFSGCIGSNGDDSELEQWVLSHTAFLSPGQAARLAPGGDHHALLGIDKLPHGIDDVLECTPSAGALRLRSGGRAATFAVGPDRDCLRGPWIDVKGVGTHAGADVSSPHVTGLLCLADALRELGMQRLLQRVLDNDAASCVQEDTGAAPQHPCTVKLYGIIDTGLTYADVNPATGWRNERCVLLLRQRQSRVIAEYECMSFSGNLPAGHRATAPGEPAAAFRRALLRNGLSSDTFPTALIADAFVTINDWDRSRRDRLVDQLVASVDVASRGNVQCDAAARYFMDMSDYYAHAAVPVPMTGGDGAGGVGSSPCSPLPAFWCMSSSALIDALCLGPPGDLAAAAGSRIAAQALFAPAINTDNAQPPPLAEWARDRRRQLAESSPAIRDAVSVWERSHPATPGQAKPKYCMSWAMELDDSAFAAWCADTAKAYAAAASAVTKSDRRSTSRSCPAAAQLLGVSILHTIDANLPRHAPCCVLSS